MIHFVIRKNEEQEKIRLKLELETFLNGNNAAMPFIFNYGLNINNWRLFVNKQILMRYERLFIEKQLNEVNVEKRRLDSEIASVMQDLERVKQQQEIVKSGGQIPKDSFHHRKGGYKR